MNEKITTKDIDVHILYMPGDNPEWTALLKSDLDRQGVTQTWLPGEVDKIGKRRSEAFEMSTKKYVAYADPDDRIPDGTYQRCLDYLENHPDVIAVYTGQSIIDKYGKIVKTVIDKYDPVRHHRDVQHVHGTVVARREYALQTVDKLRIAPVERWVYSLLLVQLGKVIGLPIDGNHYRRHYGQFSRNTTHELKAEAYKLATGNEYV